RGGAAAAKSTRADHCIIGKIFLAESLRQLGDVAVRKKKPKIDRCGRSKSAPAKIKVPSLSELVAQITPENRYPEITMGPPRGKELLAILETLEPLNEEFPEI